MSDTEVTHDCELALGCMACREVDLRAAIEAQRQGLSGLTAYSSYNKGLDDALCWVLDLMEGKAEG